MAGRLDLCRFYPVDAGLGDWEVDIAVRGYLDDEQSEAIDGEEYHVRAETADLVQWEVATGVYDLITRTFRRTVVEYSSDGGKGGNKIDFTEIPQVGTVILAKDLTRGYTGDGVPDEAEPIADGSFHIQRNNQDFWLREEGAWVRKGNIRDEGPPLIGISPVINLGYAMGAAVTRTRFLGSVAHDLGITMLAAIDLVREIEASSVYGFVMSVAVTHEREEVQITTAMDMGLAMTSTLSRTTQLSDAMSLGFAMDAILLMRIRLLVASMSMGYAQASALSRTTELTDAMSVGYAMAAAISHATPALPKFLVLGLSVSPWTLWYDGNLDAMSTPAGSPTSAVVHAIASPDGNLLVIATSAALFRFDTSVTPPVYMGAFPSPPAWTSIKAVEFNAAGTRLAVIDSAVSPFCWVYDTATWTTVTAPTTGIAVNIASIAWDGTANSKIAAGRTSASIRTFDTPGMAISGTQPGTQPSVSAWTNVQFSPNGSYLAGNGGATPSPMRVWQMSSLAAPLANPGTMPANNSANTHGALVWNPAGTKFFLGDIFGCSIYNVSGTTVSLDTRFDYNVKAGGYAVWKRDGTKLFATRQSATPLFFVKIVSGWTDDTTPSTQPAANPSCIASNI